jgi:predicted phage replisome organizer
MENQPSEGKVKKYYWLRLKRDFFKRHDTRIIESMENGKDYLLFYLKLLVESIDHEGALRFSDTLPYNDKMLASITDTNIDIVRSAIKVFAELGMMEMMDDGTLFMAHVLSMIGDETEWAEKKRIYRQKKTVQIETQEGQKRTMSDKSLELEKDIDINTMPNGKKDDPFFESFWTAYPRKEGKGQAKKAYASRIKKGATHELIMDRLKIYSAQLQAAKTERQFIRHPATFLNNLDDYEQLSSEPEESEFMRLHKPKPMTDEEREMIMRSYNHA